MLNMMGRHYKLVRYLHKDRMITFFVLRLTRQIKVSCCIEPPYSLGIASDFYVMCATMSQDPINEPFYLRIFLFV